MTELDREYVEQHTASLAREWADTLGAVVLLKHVPTIISNGEKTYFNTRGNPGMATAGSGDVLAGIIGGLLARGVDALDATVAGAFWHSCAGDEYVSANSQENLTASGIIQYLPMVIRRND
jgi:NAD(P)H-hydrate epimerase